MLNRLIILFIIFNFSCLAQEQKKIEIHGHRGFRGKYPENTLTAFKEAAKEGVDYIELDVIISKDSQVVVSHEPWFNATTCSYPNGKTVKKLKQGNLHRLNYSEIRNYDCGKRGNKKFPQQAKIAEYKPLLSEVIGTMELFCRENNLPSIHYNIEIKNNALGDWKYHFEPKITAELVYDVLKKYDINERILIQSFDVRSLKAIHQLNNKLKLGLLVTNFRSVNFNIKKLGFTPYSYNPALKICKKSTIIQAHNLGCKVIVWTVDSEKEMKRILMIDADGFITDYPNIANKLR